MAKFKPKPRTVNVANCPKCGRSCKSNTDVWYCGQCQFQFDNDPDEGGDFDDRNPAARMEREERRRGRR